MRKQENGQLCHRRGYTTAGASIAQMGSSNVECNLEGSPPSRAHTHAPHPRKTAQVSNLATPSKGPWSRRTVAHGVNGNRMVERRRLASAKRAHRLHIGRHCSSQLAIKLILFHTPDLSIPVRGQDIAGLTTANQAKPGSDHPQKTASDDDY